MPCALPPKQELGTSRWQLLLGHAPAPEGRVRLLRALQKGRKRARTRGVAHGIWMRGTRILNDMIGASRILEEGELLRMSTTIAPPGLLARFRFDRRLFYELKHFNTSQQFGITWKI